MNLSRKTTIRINYLFDELLPPFIRDSKLFYFFWRILFKKESKNVLNFKANYKSYSNEKFIKLYRDTYKYHLDRDTDLNEKCEQKILTDIEEDLTDSILEIGCGRGRTIKIISEKYPLKNVTGLDIVINSKLKKEAKSIVFKEGSAEELPFKDNSFDTVICTHVLEHLVDYHKAIKEIRRVAKRKFIIIVPKQRPYKYTFDLHINFFPYDYSLYNSISCEK